MISLVPRVFRNNRSVPAPVTLPPATRTPAMSLYDLITSLNVQDDEATAAVIAIAFNADQSIRSQMRQDITFDVPAVRRIARALADHTIPLEPRRTAPKIANGQVDAPPSEQPGDPS